jgi:hypothetical protein
MGTTRLAQLLAAAAACLLPGLTRAELNASSAELLWAPYDLEGPEQPVEYLLLRKELVLTQPASQLASAVIEVTAQQSSPKILSAYKLWVNDHAISNGPGRNAHCTAHLQPDDVLHGSPTWRTWHCNGTAQGYDRVNVTAAIQSTAGVTGAGEVGNSVVLALQGWSWSGSGPPRGHASQGGIMALLTLRFSDGSTQTVATESSNATADQQLAEGGADTPWMSFNATPAFNPGHAIGGMYYQPSENIIMALWPSGWRKPGYAASEATGWRPAIVSSARMPADFVAKGASAVVQRYRPAVALEPVVPANCSGYRYIVDMGAKNALFLRHFILKTIISPRQARDKHEEPLKTRGVSRRPRAAGWHSARCQRHRV